MPYKAMEHFSELPTSLNFLIKENILICTISQHFSVEIRHQEKTVPYVPGNIQYVTEFQPKVYALAETSRHTVKYEGKEYLLTAVDTNCIFSGNVIL